MRITFTRDTENERYVDGFTIRFKNGRVIDIFVSFIVLKHVKTLFNFFTDDKDWMIRFWIFNVQYTANTSVVWDEILEGLD